MPEKLGLKEVVAMGVGGLIGGGIFAVLGIAADVAGNAAIVSYLVAGSIALASSYSYVRMTAHLDEEGGSFTFLEHYVDNPKIAGMVGWILIVGYIGTMAMYAYAFGAFTASLLGVPVEGVIRSIISMAVITLFLGINLVGVRESGHSEDIMVYAKVAILLAFGIIGAWSILTRPTISVFAAGLFNHGVSNAIIGVAVIFVSFEGWQLLTYEISDIRGGVDILEKGVYASIILSTLIYILVAFVTTQLMTPAQIMQHTETVLAHAASKIFAGAVIDQAAFVLVAIAALFSTASAINATLFGTARFAYKIATEHQLPELFSFRNREGIPSRALIVISVLTAAFTVLGTLQQITEFASVSFLGVFGVVNYVCLRDPDVRERAWIPAYGLIGVITAIPLLLWHLWNNRPHILYSIFVIFIVLLYLEFIYFEREPLKEAARKVEEEVEAELEDVEHEVEDELDELERELDGEN